MTTVGSVRRIEIVLTPSFACFVAERRHRRRRHVAPTRGVGDLLERVGKPHQLCVVPCAAQQLDVDRLSVIVLSWSGLPEITGAWDLLRVDGEGGFVREQALTRDAAELDIRIVKFSEHPRLRGAAALVLPPAFAAPTVA